uniref:Transient receptor potential cation channel trpm n=1 Tax=Cacopsylla melanoneura TaxID=428564 RepID=A0A8D8RTN9_9HEMI
MKSKNTVPQKLYAARSWIEATFQKRECIKFIPSSQDEHRCCCGLSLTFHCGTGITNPSSVDTSASQHEVWSASLHTGPSNTDAYGTIEFQGGPHPSKAQYVRLSYDTRPENILQLFTREWSLELPKLLITVQGGKANFELQPKLKKVLRKGLLKAAKTTGAWVFTGGTNTGVTRQVGDALLMERSQRSGRVVSIGIAPWGIVENNHELIGHNKDVPYHSISSPRSKFAVLNNRHAYFLLVDNGTAGKYGAEVVLRRKLEKYISNQKLHPGTHCSTPVVCLVIEGGTNTIRAVLEYVTDTPPVPVVVCDGSGRAADLLAFTHKYASEDGEQTVLENMKDYLINTIQRTFEVGQEQAECLYVELLECTRKKNLITVFRISDRTGGEGNAQELDQTILTALFKSQHLSPSEQLSLALTWNRVDIARSEIFVYGQEWPVGALDEAMMQALEHDRIDFVKLLLENGVSMRKFLTIPRLEELYNTKQGPSNTMGFILRDVRPHIPRGYMYTLHDIGLVINKLMGGAYRAPYTRRKFRLIYAKVMKKSPNFHRNSASFIKYYGNTNLTLSLLAGTMPTSENMHMFEYPFNELLIWAVLTKRQEMALLMWQHGEEALAKSLVGCKLYKAMAHEAAEDDLETEIFEELRSYGKVFEDIALELLDFCYRQDDDQTQQLLTCELQNWSGQTCLSLAVAANHRPLLAHPCSQIILADLWMGGLRTRKHTNVKVIMGLLCPFYIARLEFKSKEELQLMPQTEEEHLYGLEDDNDNDSVENGTTHNPAHRNTDADVEESHTLRETVVTENGKVIPEPTGSIDSDSVSQFYPLPRDFFVDIKQNRPLRLKRKLYEFYTAPITKFYAHSIAYLIFLVTFSYVVLVKMETTPSTQELYVIFYIATMGCEKVREIISSEPVAISHKFSVWAWNMWNPCDAAAIIFFMIGLSLRIKPSSMPVGRVIFCVDIIYWYLRILNIVGVNKYLGPLVTMMGKMVKNMIYFVVLLLVVLMSFGVCRQSILFPDSEPSWSLAREVFFQPYFMLYGEVFANKIYPPDCTDNPVNDDEAKCVSGRWVPPLVMSMYLLVSNILLVNLLIAVFNNIFMEINAISHQVWMFQRFTVVMEYEQKPALPPPFIIFSHILLFVKYLRRKCEGVRETYDNGLKLFLDKEDLERLYDFEEECVEGYFREKETKLAMSTDERIRNTTERVENINQKVEDINQKENSQNSSIQALEFRLRKLEDLSEQTLSTLSVIHRFMATHSNASFGGGSGGHTLPTDVEARLGLPPLSERLRKTSERSEIHSDQGDFVVVPPQRRRPPTRSMTEIRPIHPFELHLDGPPPVTSAPQGDIKQSSSNDLNMDNFAEEDEINAAVEENKVEVGTENSETSSISRRRGLSFSIGDGEEDVVGMSKLNIRRRRQSSSSVSNGADMVLGSDILAPTAGVVPRQLSQTHSEPDNSMEPHTMVKTCVERSVTWAEPRIKVIPPPTPARSMLMAMHTEYTRPTQDFSWVRRDRSKSITDELETVCGLLSPPRSPRLLSPPVPGEMPPPSAISGGQTGRNFRRSRHASEMSNPEMAVYLEKEHLRDAEESDYHLMEEIIHHRFNNKECSDADKFDNNAFFLTVNEETASEIRANRSLRRSSAIEIGEMATPTTSRTPSVQSPTSAPPDHVPGAGADPRRKNSKSDSLTVPNSAETMC